MLLWSFTGRGNPPSSRSVSLLLQTSIVSNLTTDGKAWGFLFPSAELLFPLLFTELLTSSSPIFLSLLVLLKNNCEWQLSSREEDSWDAVLLDMILKMWFNACKCWCMAVHHNYKELICTRNDMTIYQRIALHFGGWIMTRQSLSSIVLQAPKKMKFLCLPTQSKF